MSFSTKVIDSGIFKNVLDTNGDSRRFGCNCSYLYPYWPSLKLNEPFYRFIAVNALVNKEKFNFNIAPEWHISLNS